MAANEALFPLSDVLISAIDPEILSTDLSAEVLAYLTSLNEVDMAKHDVLLNPLSLDKTLYEVWWAATTLKLYAMKHGRYVMPMPVMGGLKRAWEGLWEVFWGIAAVKFPRNKSMTLARSGMDPCIIATPADMKGTASVKVVTMGGDPGDEALGKILERTINLALQAQED